MNEEFISLIRELAPDAIEFSPSSVQQLQQLLYAPFKRKDPSKDKSVNENLPEVDVSKFQTKKKSKSSFWEPTAAEAEGQADPEAEAEEAAEGADEDDPFKIVRNFRQVDDFPEVREFKVEKLPDYDYTRLGLSDKEKRSKFRLMKIKGFGIPSEGLSEKGVPSVDTDALRLLLDGRVKKHFEWGNQKARTGGGRGEGGEGHQSAAEHAADPDTHEDLY